MISEGSGSMSKRFEMTLSYWMMVERYPNLKEEIGGSIPSWEISSLLDKKICQVVQSLPSRKI
jgi:hypothetical protein